MSREVSLVLGTAGHIDHGKTLLVQALTGVNCDRLEEERRRGITIELGFAALTLPSQRVVSLVDVPGHEGFIRQMAAGASGLDGVLLAVAADEGVRAQTREHLDILGLLGVQQGVVALTKSDLVDRQRLELAREEVRDLTEGTFLEDCPVVAVSSVTGAGIPELLEELDLLVDRLKPKDRRGPFFMAIDRAFPVAGFGPVVTGTAYRGSISLGDEVELLPGRCRSRIRSIQVHGQPVEEATAGQRVALCLSDLEMGQIGRGDVVCAQGAYGATSCLDVALEVLDGAPQALGHWQRVRLHLGSADLLARVVLLEEKVLEPGHRAPAQLVLEAPLAAALGQRFVIRHYSPLRTIGGGAVLDPYGRRPSGRRAREALGQRLLALQGLDSEDRLARILELKGRWTLEELALRCQERQQDLIPLLEKLEARGQLVRLGVGGVVLSAQEAQRWSQRFRQALEAHHRDFPHQAGLAAGELIQRLFPQKERRLGRAFLNYLVAQAIVTDQAGLLRLPDFQVRQDQAFSQDREGLLKLCRQRGFQMPRLEELPSAMGKTAQETASLVDQLRKSGDVAIVDGFLLAREVEQQLVTLLRTLEGTITLAQIRDLTGTSRKYLVPLMEHLDGKAVTRRVGDRRVVLGNR